MARVMDLTEDLVDRPPAEFLAAPAWRVHFHVPVDAEHLGPLGRLAVAELAGGKHAADPAVRRQGQSGAPNGFSRVCHHASL